MASSAPPSPTLNELRAGAAALRAAEESASASAAAPLPLAVTPPAAASHALNTFVPRRRPLRRVPSAPSPAPVVAAPAAPSAAAAASSSGLSIRVPASPDAAPVPQTPGGTINWAALGISTTPPPLPQTPGGTINWAAWGLNTPSLEAAAAAAAPSSRRPATAFNTRRPLLEERGLGPIFPPHPGAPAAAPAAAAAGRVFITSKFQPGNIPIPFLNTMDTNAKKDFKPKINAINAKKAELAALAKRIQNQHAPLNAAIQSKRGLGVLNVGDKSFMGKNGPRVYVAENKGDYIVRGNFMQNGLPLRVTDPNSFNAVLAAMKAKRRNVSKKVGNLRTLTQAVNSLEKDYGVKQAELAKMVKSLQKEHEEYLSKRAKEARASRRTVLPGAAPSAMTAAAKKELEAPKKPGFFGRLFGKGGTRRRSRTHKTRKNRKNNRR